MMEINKHTKTLHHTQMHRADPHSRTHTHAHTHTQKSIHTNTRICFCIYLRVCACIYGCNNQFFVVPVGMSAYLRKKFVYMNGVESGTWAYPQKCSFLGGFPNCSVLCFFFCLRPWYSHVSAYPHNSVDTRNFTKKFYQRCLRWHTCSSWRRHTHARIHTYRLNPSPMHARARTCTRTSTCTHERAIEWVIVHACMFMSVSSSACVRMQISVPFL